MTGQFTGNEDDATMWSNQAMKTPTRILALALVLTASAAPAQAFDQPRAPYTALLAQSAEGQRAPVPASYRIVQDDTRAPAALEGASRYYGGAIRTLIIDGRPVRLSEREIIENVRAGRFVPVYTETGARLSREDWEISLPAWLGQATSDQALR